MSKALLVFLGSVVSPRCIVLLVYELYDKHKAFNIPTMQMALIHRIRWALWQTVACVSSLYRTGRVLACFWNCLVFFHTNHLTTLPNSLYPFPCVSCTNRQLRPNVQFIKHGRKLHLEGRSIDQFEFLKYINVKKKLILDYLIYFAFLCLFFKFICIYLTFDIFSAS